MERKRKTILIVGLLLIILVLAILAGVFVFRNLPQSTLNTKPLTTTSQDGITVGIYPGGGKVASSYEEDLGIKFDHLLLFQEVKKLDYNKVIPHLNRGYDIILNVEFNDDYKNLQDIARGKYDAQLIKLAEDIRKDGRQIWLRPLHEFNGNWYNWGVFYKGNNIADFKPAWQHVVTLFRDLQAPVKFQLNYNRYNGKDDKTPFGEMWVGDEWVDMVVITNYNRAYTDEWHQYWHSFDEDFRSAYDQVVELTTKPIGVAEMSSTSYGGDKPKWIYDAFQDIAYKYPKVRQITWFAYNRPVGDMIWDWDLNTPEEKDAFIRGYITLKQMLH